jgi:hypothetical protein
MGTKARYVLTDKGWRTAGLLLAGVLPMDDKQCRVFGCERDAERMRMCEPHYTRVRRHGDVLAEVPISTRLRWLCAECGEPVEVTRHRTPDRHRRAVNHTLLRVRSGGIYDSGELCPGSRQRAVRRG